MASSKKKMVRLSLQQCRLLLLDHFAGKPLPPKFVRHLKRLGWVSKWDESVTDKGKAQLAQIT